MGGRRGRCGTGRVWRGTAQQLRKTLGDHMGAGAGGCFIKHSVKQHIKTGMRPPVLLRRWTGGAAGRRRARRGGRGCCNAQALRQPPRAGLTLVLFVRCTPRQTWSRQRLQGAPVFLVAIGSGGTRGWSGTGLLGAPSTRRSSKNALSPGYTRNPGAARALRRPRDPAVAPGRGAPISQSNLPSSMTDAPICGTSVRSTPGLAAYCAWAMALPAQSVAATSAASAHPRFHEAFARCTRPIACAIVGEALPNCCRPTEGTDRATALSIRNAAAGVTALEPNVDCN